MKLTLSQAMKTIKTLESKKDYLDAKEEKEFTYSYIEDEEPIVPDYSFKKTNEELEKLDRKIMELKIKINTANATCKIDFENLTIAEALIKMSQISKDLTRLAPLMRYSNITRCVTRSGKIEYTKTMEDIENVRKEYEFQQKALSELQLALDMANSSYTIEADL